MKKLIIALALLMPLKAEAYSTIYSCGLGLNKTNTIKYTKSIYGDSAQILNDQTDEWQTVEEQFKQYENYFDVLELNTTVKNFRIRTKIKATVKGDWSEEAPDGTLFTREIFVDLNTLKRTNLTQFFDTDGNEITPPSYIMFHNKEFSCQLVRVE